MLNLNISKPIYEKASIEEQAIPMEIDETKVKFFKVFTMYKGMKKERRNLIYWHENHQIITYENHYEYIKNNIVGFTKYTDRNNDIYLVNSKLYAGTEKYDWGICIIFTDGDGVSLELV